MDVFMAGPNNKWVTADGDYERTDPGLSSAFLTQVADLVTALEFQAADLRYRFRVSQDGAVMVKLPVNQDMLLVFLAATEPLRVRGIRADWSAWYKGH